MEEIIRTRESLTTFLTFCARFKKIDIKQYHDRLGSTVNYETLNLASLFKIASVPEIKNKNFGPPKVTCFEKIFDSPEDIKLMNRINRMEKVKSVIYVSYFEEMCTKMEVPRIDLRLVLDQVVPMSLKKLIDLTKQIESGTIKLSEIDKFVIEKFNGENRKFREEFCYICDQNFTNQSLVLKRKNQMKVYLDFKSSLKAAQFVNKIREKYNLKGKFVELDELLKIHMSNELQKWSLDKMDQNIENTIKVLQSISKEEQTKCLEVYLEAYDLVMWLRKNTKDLKESKFLVDLILTTKSNEYAQLTSLSKNAIAISLKDACQGYAALIYELKPEQDGFARLAQLCEKVWHNFKLDPKIAEKLLAVKSEL